MSNNQSTTIKKMISAAQAGGSVVAKYFGKELKTTTKSLPSDFYTKADVGSERSILNSISRSFPNYNILSEERGLLNKHSDYTFIIDPLDGTNNFVMGIPNFSIAIALENDNITTHAVVYQPLLKRIYYAELNQGAYCGGKRLHVSHVRDIRHATVAYSCSYGVSDAREIAVSKQIRSLRVKRLLSTWSPAIDFCLLASGKIEAIVSDQNEKYDYFAGQLIAKEAGALVTDFSGKKIINDNTPTFIAGNNQIIQRALIGVVS